MEPSSLADNTSNNDDNDNDVERSSRWRSDRYEAALRGVLREVTMT